MKFKSNSHTKIKREIMLLRRRKAKRYTTKCCQGKIKWTKKNMANNIICNKIKEINTRRRRSSH